MHVPYSYIRARLLGHVYWGMSTAAHQLGRIYGGMSTGACLLGHPLKCTHTYGYCEHVCWGTFYHVWSMGKLGHVLTVLGHLEYLMYVYIGDYWFSQGHAMHKSTLQAHTVST